MAKEKGCSWEDADRERRKGRRSRQSKAVIPRKCPLVILNAQSHQALSMRSLFVTVMLKTTTTLFFCVSSFDIYVIPLSSFLFAKWKKGIYAAW